MTGINILIGLAVLVLILYRQLQARPVRDNMRLPLILGHHHCGYLHP